MPDGGIPKMALSNKIIIYWRGRCGETEKKSITIIIVFGIFKLMMKKQNSNYMQLKISHIVFELEKTKKRKTNEKEMMSFNPIKLWYMRARSHVCACLCFCFLIMRLERIEFL